MTASILYVLCFLTSLACAVLLWRGYRRSRIRLLSLTGGCFAALALNNVMVMGDHLWPGGLWGSLQSLPALAGVVVLVYGLIQEGGS